MVVVSIKGPCVQVVLGFETKTRGQDVVVVSEQGWLDKLKVDTYIDISTLEGP